MITLKYLLSKINKTRRANLVDYLECFVHPSRKHVKPEEVRVLIFKGADTAPSKDKQGSLVFALRDGVDYVLIVDSIRGRGREAYDDLVVSKIPAARIAEFVGDAAPELFDDERARMQAELDATREALAKARRGGRPHRTLSDAEQDQINELRKAGESVKSISTKMHISDRVISLYLRSLSLKQKNDTPKR